MQEKNILMKLAVGALALGLVFMALVSFLYIKKIKRDLFAIRAALLKDNDALRNQTERLRETVVEKEDALNLAEKDKKRFEEEANSLKEENEKLHGDLDEKVGGLTKKKAALKKRISKLESAPLTEWIKNIMQVQSDQKIKNILGDTLSKIEMVKSGKAVTLEPIEVSAADKKGSILSIDRKNDLIVINLGSKDGLMEGDRLNIYAKDGKQVASAEIISARYTISAAFVDDMNYGTNIKSIKEGLSVAIVEKK
jgi:hypothetical protein